MPLLREILERPVIVVVIRHPWEVARSLRTRNGVPEDVGLALWERYTQSALAHSRGLPRHLVDYNDLVVNPELKVPVFLRALEHVAGGKLSLSAEGAAGVIEPGLRRETHSHMPDGVQSSPAMALYEALRSDGLETLAPETDHSDTQVLRVFEAMGGVDRLRRSSENDALVTGLNQVKQSSRELKGDLVARSEAIATGIHQVKHNSQELKAALAASEKLRAETKKLIEKLAQEKSKKSDAVARQARAELIKTKLELDHAKQKIQKIRSSTTWRMGGPIRIVGRFLRRTWRAGAFSAAPGIRNRSAKANQRSKGKATSGLSLGQPIAGRPSSRVASVDIIVPVHEALGDTKSCLVSLRRHRDQFDQRIIVVNDGSGTETTAWLKQYCKNNDKFTLIDIGGNKGYTNAINRGLAVSDADYVVTLNSDTIVSQGWLQALVACAESDPNIGIVGPLSNAATWQSVPDLLDPDTGKFAINALPQGVNPDQMAALISKLSSRGYPRTPFVNGFCYLIKRAVIDAIGTFDTQNFPVGYGEENDFSIRTADAGFDLAIADDCYVYHAKSKSFGHERRTLLSAQGMPAPQREARRSTRTGLDTVAQVDCSPRPSPQAVEGNSWQATRSERPTLQGPPCAYIVPSSCGRRRWGRTFDRPRGQRHAPGWRICPHRAAGKGPCPVYRSLLRYA